MKECGTEEGCIDGSKEGEKKNQCMFEDPGRDTFRKGETFQTSYSGLLSQ